MIDVETIFDSEREEYEFMQEKKEQQMKILKHPKILPCECAICHAVFQPKWRNLYKSGWRNAKECVHCPMCKASNDVHFEKGATDERAD